jgi:hypothetical protein
MVCSGFVGRFWMARAHPDQPRVIMDALDRVSVWVELGDNGGWEANPAGRQFGTATG